MKKRRAGLDKYDVAILSALAANTRLTTVELARKVHLSRTAVSRRIAALKKMKVLNDSADVLNYELMGFQVRASVEIATNGRSVAAVKPGLLERPDRRSDVLGAQKQRNLSGRFGSDRRKLHDHFDRGPSRRRAIHGAVGRVVHAYARAGA